MDRDILLMLMSVILGIALPYLCRIFVSFVKGKSNDALLQTFGLYTTNVNANGELKQRYRYCQIAPGTHSSYKVCFGDSVETKKLGCVSIKKKSVTHRGTGEFVHGILQLKIRNTKDKLRIDEFYTFKVTEQPPYWGLHLGTSSTLDSYSGIALLIKMGALPSVGKIEEHYKLCNDENNFAIVSSTAKFTDYATQVGTIEPPEK